MPSSIARALGRRGGRARAERLSAAEKKRIAGLGAAARIQSLQAERRITANFLYAGMVATLQPHPAVRRLHVFAGPLPSIRGPRTKP